MKDRLVEPFAFSTNLIDVWAYDLSDLHNKVFKISRIVEVETLDEDWEFEGSHRRQSTDVFRMSYIELWAVSRKRVVSGKPGRSLYSANGIQTFIGPASLLSQE